MKIIKIICQNDLAHDPVYLVVDNYADAEVLFKKNYGSWEIERMELISDKVINQWAQ